MAMKKCRYRYLLLLALWLVCLPGGANGHGALSFPRPRNALDGGLPPWETWAYPCDKNHTGAQCRVTFCEDGQNCQGSCPISSHDPRDRSALNASNGQACYWFSNGCTVGCTECDGTHNHYGHGAQKFLYKGLTNAQLLQSNQTIPNPWDPPVGDMQLDPRSTGSLNVSANCEKPLTKPTICDPRLRTCNTQAPCGSPLDIYYYSPWRAPGAAPVIDPCGVAGGRLPGMPIGPAGAQYQNTSRARLGDKGSSLPAMLPQAAWKRGSLVEVGWTVMANHGGGYAYRIAPAAVPLSEEEFRKTPLNFVGNSALRWGGEKETQLEFNTTQLGWEVSAGTVPEGSTWRKNPIPTILWEREGPSFQPVCEESAECIAAAVRGWKTQGVCKCSGHSNGGPLLPNLEMVDVVEIPADLEPGHYVLQFRWDCEESDQVWASCSDVTITA